MKNATHWLSAAFAIGAVMHMQSVHAQCTIPSTVPKTAYTVKHGLSYTATPNNYQAIDLYVPTMTVQPPLVVALHQGSFVKGSDKEFISFAEKMATFGIATAAINYRLEKAGQNEFPAAISDVRCAVRWLSANATALNISATTYGGLGTSAGGNIVGLLGTNAMPDASFDSTPGCLIPYAGQQPAMTAIADYYGLNVINDPTALNKLQTRNATHYLGVAPSANEALAAEASPLTYVSSSTPQFFLARGTADTTMPEAQASLMQAALQNAGVPVQYWQVDGLVHGFEPLDVADYPQLQDSACALVSFYQSALGVVPPAPK